MDKLEALQKRPKGWPVLQMRWENLLFLHWRWDVKSLQMRVPKGLTVEAYDGTAWLGIVPFFMRRVTLPGLPRLPWISDFLELNVRTYVMDERGRPGVWFFSLSCNQPLAVWAACWSYGLNYVPARMTAKREGQTLTYLSERDKRETRLIYEPAHTGELAEKGTLEYFLLERYLLFAQTRRGTLVSGQIHHAPYRWKKVHAKRWDFEAAAADGFDLPGREPDHQVVTEPLDVQAWPIKRI